jgi:membrane protein YdbS with pleckstrin-like domain
MKRLRSPRMQLRRPPTRRSESRSTPEAGGLAGPHHPGVRGGGAPNNAEHQLWYDRVIDLNQQFPMANRFVIRKAFPFIAAASIMLILFILFFGISGLVYLETPPQQLCYGIIRLALIAALGAVGYWEIYRRTTIYRIEGFRLIIRKGVFLQVHASLPLLPVADLIIHHKDPLDVLFGLYRLDIHLPMDSESKLASIPGLSHEYAFSLQHFLSGQLDEQIFISEASLNEAAHHQAAAGE